MVTCLGLITVSFFLRIFVEFVNPSSQLREAIKKDFNLKSSESVDSALEDIFNLFKRATLGGSKKFKKIQEIPQRLREVGIV